jgi:CubicO group peptidase (beta-lactamase class C family)
MSEEVIPVPLTTELDALFRHYIAAEQSRGIVYGVTTADGLSHTAGFGEVDDNGLVPDADTVFPIASMSKSFIACAALIARDRGFLSLTDPITKFVPEFRIGDGGAEPDAVPSIEMLFSMCGGLTEDNAWVDPFIDLPTEVLLATVAKGIRLSRLPGAAYEYSNLGYTMAGLAVSRAVGRPLADWVRDELLVPLGLRSTYFDNAVPADVERAVGYSLDGNGNWVGYPPNSSDAFIGAGGIMSTIRDLAKWVTWLGSAFRPPREGDADILSRASRRELQRIHIATPPSLTTGTTGALEITTGGYGLGLGIKNDLHRGTFISHSGGLPGFSLYMCWHPDSGNGVVVLTNSHRGDPAALGDEALGRILVRHEVPAATVVLWPETLSLRAEAERLIRNWDDRLAARIFSDNVDFDRPLAERRAEIERLVDEVGPLLEPRPSSSIVSSVTSADITWSIPAARGELLCMIHLTPVEPAQIQEFVIKAFPSDRPRGTRPIDISPRRSHLRGAYITAVTNVEVRFP